MSGLELFIIIAAGVYITKKVRARKEQKQLAAGGITSHPLGTQIHGAPQLVDGTNQQRQKQHGSAEEDQLPAYTPPSNQSRTAQSDEKGWLDLPSYDETQRGTEERNRRNGIRTDVAEAGVPLVAMAQNARVEAATASPDETSKARSKRWKVWKKERVEQAA
ncbi:hypothetical protein PMZ80_000969 [Knufia obscura]|uniref:Uncharacterized protein n=2 Tax=Knufia TaxID=430999 RepID=A0AAN8I1Y1_9EURO|nr:hypothetical protein PMZ80_000969 [Knufia obscura]KAK5950237.1 hypothetical protein OHC33_008705 [Knufia fluminis]